MTIEEDILEHIEHRAKHNRRSLNQEIMFLLECAISADIEDNQEILRTLMRAQGGVVSVHTAKDEPANET